MIRFSQSPFVRNLGPDPIHPHRGQPVGLPLGDTLVLWNHNHQPHSTPEPLHGIPPSPRVQSLTVPGVPIVDRVPSPACSTHPTSVYLPSSSVDVASLIPSTVIAPHEYNLITKASVDVPSPHSLEAITEIQDGTELNLEASDKHSLALLRSPGEVAGRRSLSVERDGFKMMLLEGKNEEYQLRQEEEEGGRKEDEKQVEGDNEGRKLVQTDAQLKKEEFKNMTGSPQRLTISSEFEEGDTMEVYQNSVGLRIAFGGKSAVSSPFLSMDKLPISSRAASEERNVLLSGGRLTSAGTDSVHSEIRCLYTPQPQAQYDEHNKLAETQMSDVEKEERLGQVVSHDTPKVGLPVLSAVSLEAVAPLRKSANRWVRSRKAQIDTDSSYIVDRKVRALLNKLTMTNFESITDQIIAWANKSGKEKDGRTLIQVIRLVFEKATNEAMWSEVYARLCKKMMEQISPKVQDDGIKDVEGNPIAGGQLFRRYLLNRCQEDFEHGWGVKKTTTLAAETIEKDEKRVSSDEFYVTQQARQRGLGLVKFIGELFKLHMLGERVMHECVKRLLVNVENPEEEDIESLCMLLSTVGEILDTPKARAHMDVYFTRMKNIDKSGNVSLRIQFTLQDIIQLRERKWVGRKPVAAPMTPTAIHETIPKRKLPRRSGFTTK